jgi:hypothetical protein
MTKFVDAAVADAPASFHAIAASASSGSRVVDRGRAATRGPGSLSKGC